MVKSNELLIYAEAWINLKNYVKWKKTEIKGHILYEYITWNIHNKKIYRDRK